MNAAPAQPWRPGSQIVMRETWRGQVWTARPVTVVQDTHELIALYMMPGTVYKHPRILEADRVPAIMPDPPVAPRGADVVRGRGALPE